MLWTVLKGRAQSLYVSDSPEVRSDYVLFKSLILRGYRLHQEAYRQKFRKTYIKSGQTHAGFARKMLTNFDNWLETEKATYFRSLRQLMLIVNFLWKINLPVTDHLRTHKKLDSLEEAADKEDGYVLAHEFVRRSTPFQNRFKDKSKYNTDNSAIKTNPVLVKNREGSGESQNGRYGNIARDSCSYCNKPGHTESTCWTKAKDLRRQTSSVNAVASLTENESTDTSPEFESESVACVAPQVNVKKTALPDVTGGVDSTVKEFDPLLSLGTVNVGGEERTVRILRDTAA